MRRACMIIGRRRAWRADAGLSHSFSEEMLQVEPGDDCVSAGDGRACSSRLEARLQHFEIISSYIPPTAPVALPSSSNYQLLALLRTEGRYVI